MPDGIGQAVHSIRVVDIEGNPWFVAKDAIVAMGYSAGSIAMTLGKIAASEVIMATRTNDYRNLLAGVRRAPSLTFISESGLYKLIMRSDKPQAKAFQDWVTQEVLPSIRKTGSFVTGQASLVENPTMDSLDLMMQQSEQFTAVGL